MNFILKCPLPVLVNANRCHKILHAYRLAHLKLRLLPVYIKLLSLYDGVWLQKFFFLRAALLAALFVTFRQIYLTAIVDNFVIV